MIPSSQDGRRVLGGPSWPAQGIWPTEPSPYIKGPGAGARTNLGRVSPPGHVLGPHGLLDAVHLLLVPALVLHGALLGLLQCTLQGLNSLSRSPKSFFQFRKLTTQICIVTYQLWGEPQVRGREKGSRGRGAGVGGGGAGR